MVVSEARGIVLRDDESAGGVACPLGGGFHDWPAGRPQASGFQRRHPEILVGSSGWSQHRKRPDTGGEAADALRVDPGGMRLRLRLLRHCCFGFEAKFARQ